MPRLAAFQTFIDRMRAHCAREADIERRYRGAVPLLDSLLADPDLRERSAAWVAPNEPERGIYRNLLFYEDPDYGFVVNALVKEPRHQTPIHDHGPIWTLYGVLDGAERVARYRRRDDGKGERADLELLDDHWVRPGFIDVVPPFDIHVEYNGDHRTVGVIVRSGNVGRTPQSWFDAADGRITRRLGPDQVPHELV